MKMPRGIHVTDRHTFKECRRQYKYSICERLTLKNEPIGSPTWFGTKMHEVLAAYYTVKKDQGIYPSRNWMLTEYITRLQELDQASSNRPDLQEMYEMGLQMISDYWEFSQREDSEWEVIAVEVPIKIKIKGTNGTLLSTLDLIVKWRGQMWIVDHKTLKDLPSDQKLDIDDQMTAYIWAAREVGYLVVGAIYNVLRKKRPTVPRLLVKGGLSQDKSMDTNLDTYMKAIEENGLDPRDYSAMIDWLTQKGNTFQYRKTIQRGTKEIQNFGKQLVDEFKEMTSSKVKMFPAPGLICNWCDYCILCKAESCGEDVAYIKEVKYRLKEDWER